MHGDTQIASDGPTHRYDLERVCVRNLLQNRALRVVFKDLQSRFLLVSAGFLLDQAAGASLDEVIGKSDFDLFRPEHAQAAYADEQWIIQTGESIVGKIERETFHDRPDAWVSTTKIPLRDDDGDIIGTFAISRDVTAQVMAEKALAHQALHDPVTGLANRSSLTDRLSLAVASLDRNHGWVGLLFVDLDNFKRINDAYGHEAGDQVLVEIGHRLSQVSRGGDTVARFGGDELVLLASSLGTADEARLIADRAVHVIRQQFVYEGNDLSVTGSIGVVVTNNPLANPGQLLQQADMALYEAKRAGRNGFRLYDPHIHARALAVQDLETELRRAIAGSELFLVYQPLFSLKDHSLRAVEALVRWQHPKRGTVLPGDFIPHAEESGLIRAIDFYVLEEACRQLAEWLSGGHCPEGFRVAVNVSGREIHDPTLASRVATTVERYGIAASALCLEVTETAFIGELGDAATTVATLSDLGVRIALDDFGTGYSTLAHVQRLNVDVLKIDGSFVKHIGSSDRDRQIIGAITAMAHALGLSVVVEGIETDCQLGELTALGCDEGQGNLLAPPLSAGEVEALCRSAPRLEGARSSAEPSRAGGLSRLWLGAGV